MREALFLLVGKFSPGQNGKVFGQAFFKKLAGRGVPVAHELAPTEPAGEKRCASGTRISADRAGRRDCGGGAPFCAAQLASLCAMRSRKRPCQPKTAKSIFGGPVPQSPAGQAKERTRILPVRRGFSAPGVPRRLPGWPSLCGLPLLWQLLRPVPRRVFSLLQP